MRQQTSRQYCQYCRQQRRASVAITPAAQRIQGGPHYAHTGDGGYWLRTRFRANCIVLGPGTIAGHERRALARRRGAFAAWSCRTVDDPARAAVFLATNDFITGAVLSVDGGEGLS